MRRALKPILFDDHDKPAADAARASIVAKAARSEAAKRKVNTKRTDDDLPVHSFQSLIADLEVRPIHHRLAQRVRAHVFLCMLAYYLEWHMRQALKSILFDDHDRAAAEAARTSIVGKAERSDAADRKAATKRTTRRPACS